MLNSRIITIITFQRCSKKRTSGAEMHFIYLFEYISNSVVLLENIAGPFKIKKREIILYYEFLDYFLKKCQI